MKQFIGCDVHMRRRTDLDTKMEIRDNEGASAVTR
jgi:hypothetical protein